MSSSILKGQVQKITLPHKMVDKYKKSNFKKEIKKRQAMRKYKGPVVISCKKKLFNHNEGQTYSNFSPHHLASHGWKSHKSKGDYFTVNATRGNPALEGDSETTRFSQLGIAQNITDVLQGYGFKTPTDIQSRCIPPLLRGNNVLCTAETGSGKTLSFLLPLVQKILQEKNKGMFQNATNSPFGVILVPSRELADQIQTVASDLIAPLNLHCASLCGGRGTQKILKYRPENMMDIVVATPGVFSKVLTNKIYNLSQLSYIVLDEVDTLMDDSFNIKTIRIIKKLSRTLGSLGSEKSYDNGVSPDRDSEEDITGLQMVMAGATIPRSLEQIVEDSVPLETFVKVQTDNVHRIMPHVPHKFYRTLNQDKPEILLGHLKQNLKKKVPTIVFCNRTKTVLFLKAILEGAGITPIALHAQTSQKKREGLFESFQNGDSDILLCTDIASRGLDTLRAQHIINFDFPQFISDYLHRSGRVGRVGSHGTGFVLSFISHKWDVDLLWTIESSVRRTTELHNVNANIKRKLTSIIREKYEDNLNIML